MPAIRGATLKNAPANRPFHPLVFKRGVLHGHVRQAYLPYAGRRAAAARPAPRVHAAHGTAADLPSVHGRTWRDQGCTWPCLGVSSWVYTAVPWSTSRVYTAVPWSDPRPTRRWQCVMGELRWLGEAVREIKERAEHVPSCTHALDGSPSPLLSSVVTIRRAAPSTELTPSCIQLCTFCTDHSGHTIHIIKRALSSHTRFDLKMTTGTLD